MILTPHMKEMSRLTGISVSEIVERRFEVLHRFTEESPDICVLKRQQDDSCPERQAELP